MGFRGRIWRGLASGGEVPEKYRAQVASEGVVLKDERLSGSISFRNYRAPGRRYGARRTWVQGSLVLTKKTFVAFSRFRPMVGVPLDHQRLRDLRLSAQGGRLVIE